MSGYGTSAWTCGKCGERFESSGVIGDMRVMQWRDAHLEEHRRAEMTPKERQWNLRLDAEIARRRLAELED